MNTRLWFISKKIFKIFHTGTFPPFFENVHMSSQKNSPLIWYWTVPKQQVFCMSSNIIKDDSALNINASNHTPEDAKMATVVKLNLSVTSGLGTVVAASKELNEFPQIFKRLTGRTAFLCQFSLSLQNLLSEQTYNSIFKLEHEQCTF